MVKHFISFLKIMFKGQKCIQLFFLIVFRLATQNIYVNFNGCNWKISLKNVHNAGECNDTKVDTEGFHREMASSLEWRTTAIEEKAPQREGNCCQSNLGDLPNPHPTRVYIGWLYFYTHRACGVNAPLQLSQCQSINNTTEEVTNEAWFRKCLA